MNRNYVMGLAGMPGDQWAESLGHLICILRGRHPGRYWFRPIDAAKGRVARGRHCSEFFSIPGEDDGTVVIDEDGTTRITFRSWHGSREGAR